MSKNLRVNLFKINQNTVLNAKRFFKMSQNLFLHCRICGNKKLEEFIGTNGHNNTKRKLWPCFREYHREWIKNKYKRLKFNRKSKLFGSSDIKKKKFLW